MKIAFVCLSLVLCISYSTNAQFAVPGSEYHIGIAVNQIGFGTAFPNGNLTPGMDIPPIPASTIDGLGSQIGTTLLNGLPIISTDTFTDKGNNAFEFVLSVTTEGTGDLAPAIIPGLSGEFPRIVFLIGQNFPGDNGDLNVAVNDHILSTAILEAFDDQGSLLASSDVTLAAAFGQDGNNDGLDDWGGFAGIAIGTTNNPVVQEVRLTITGTLIAMPGDINCDGVVDLLDVQPFVDIILGAPFNAKADLNDDGVVDLLDVAPFVALLLG